MTSQQHQHQQQPISASRSSTMTTTSSSSGGSSSMEDVVDRIRVMRKQEDECYDYRHCLLQPKLTSSDGGGKRSYARINVTWREKIVTWSYNVVDHFDLSREVVAVSLSLFDRYLATACNNQVNGNLALLTSLTTLQIAIKLHYPQKLERITLHSLSRGQFDQAEMERMEWTILSTLNWRLHPPTPYSFLTHYLQLLPSSSSCQAATTTYSLRKDLLDLSRYLTELAVCDSYFCPVNASTVALASLLNVMDEMSYSYFPAELRQAFRSNLTRLAKVSCNSPAVQAARERLAAMFTRTPSSHSTQEQEAAPQSPPPATVSSGNYYNDDGCAVVVVGTTSPPSVITQNNENHPHHTQHHTRTNSTSSDLVSLSSYGSNGSFFSKNSWYGGTSNGNGGGGNQSVTALTIATNRSDSFSPFSPSSSSSNPRGRCYQSYAGHQHQHYPSTTTTGSTKIIVSPSVALTTVVSRTAPSRSSRSSSPIIAGLQ